jgi:hypothetical protein
MIHVSVAIFPDDARAVTKTDGSLHTMSYWYGKVAKIYLRPRGETHVSVFHMQMISLANAMYLIKDVWLDIQWYYRRVDLEDAGVECFYFYFHQSVIYLMHDTAWLNLSLNMNWFSVTT